MKLTEEQKKLVEDNHNLIYGYCHRYNLNVEEYYGDLAVTLCEAAQTYKEEKSKTIHKCFERKYLKKF